MNTSAPRLQAALFKALAHPIRIAILDALRWDEACVCHLEALLQVRQAYLSQQLAVLRKAGLIADRRDGLNIFYRIVRPDVLPVIDSARRAVGVEGVALQPPAVCPCPKCTPAARSAQEPIRLVEEGTPMVTVKVLGPGCANCKRLEALVNKVVAEHGVQAEVEKVTDYAQMMRWNLMKTPGLVVNDTLVVAGRVPSEAEIAGFLTT